MSKYLSFIAPNKTLRLGLLKQICIFIWDPNLCGITISSLMKNELAVITD